MWTVPSSSMTVAVRRSWSSSRWRWAPSRSANITQRSRQRLASSWGSCSACSSNTVDRVREERSAPRVGGHGRELFGLGDADVAGGERVDHHRQVLDQGGELQAGSDLAVGEVGVGSQPAGHRAVTVVEEQLPPFRFRDHDGEFRFDATGLEFQVSESFRHGRIVEPGEFVSQVVDTGGDHELTLSYVCAKVNQKNNK